MTAYERACAASERVAAILGHPVAQVAFLALCVLWWAFAGSMLLATTLLSIVSITITQLILNSQRREAAALKLQMAELIRAVPDARDELADADRMTAAEIEAARQ